MKEQERNTAAPYSSQKVERISGTQGWIPQQVCLLPLARISGCPPDSSLCKPTVSHATDYGFASGREHFFLPMSSSAQCGSSFLIREGPGQAASREACMAGELQPALLLPKDTPSPLTTPPSPRSSMANTQPPVSDLSVCHTILPTG